MLSRGLISGITLRGHVESLNAEVLVATAAAYPLDDLVNFGIPATIVVQCTLEDLVVNIDINTGV